MQALSHKPKKHPMKFLKQLLAAMFRTSSFDRADEAYLAKATDIADVERRMQELSRRAARGLGAAY